MRGVKRCQESTGRIKKHRYSNEFKVTDQRIVILKSLPALQCENCAQYVIEDAVLGRVDEILATGDGAAELEVIRYAA